MSLKKCSKKVIMSEEERKSFNEEVKTKENDWHDFYKKNKEKFPKIEIFKNNKNKYFFVRGSFEKHLFLKHKTNDYDVHLFIKNNDYFKNDKELKDFKKVQGWKDKIKDILEQAWKSRYIKNTTTKPSIDFTLSKTKKGKKPKVLSIIPILIYDDKYYYFRLDQANEKSEAIVTRNCDVQNWFNEKIKCHSKRRRNNIRKVIRIIKYLFKPNFQNLPTSVLEHYIFDSYFNCEKPWTHSYLNLFQTIFDDIRGGDLEKYVKENKEQFEKYHFLDKNKQALEQIKKYAKNKKICTWDDLDKLINQA